MSDHNLSRGSGSVSVQQAASMIITDHTKPAVTFGQTNGYTETHAHTEKRVSRKRGYPDYKGAGAQICWVSDEPCPTGFEGPRKPIVPPCPPCPHLLYEDKDVKRTLHVGSSQGCVMSDTEREALYAEIYRLRNLTCQPVLEKEIRVRDPNQSARILELEQQLSKLKLVHKAELAVFKKPEPEIVYREVEKLINVEKIVKQEVQVEKIVYKENKKISREYQGVIKMLRGRILDLEHDVTRWQEKCAIFRCENGKMKKTIRQYYDDIMDKNKVLGKKDDQNYGLQAKIVGLRAEDMRKENQIDQLQDTVNQKDCQIMSMEMPRLTPAPKVETKVEVRYKDRIVKEIVEVPVEILVEPRFKHTKMKVPNFDDIQPRRVKKKKEYIEETYLVMGPCPGQECTPCQPCPELCPIEAVHHTEEIVPQYQTSTVVYPAEQQYQVCTDKRKGASFLVEAPCSQGHNTGCCSGCKTGSAGCGSKSKRSQSATRIPTMMFQSGCNTNQMAETRAETIPGSFVVNKMTASGLSVQQEFVNFNTNKRARRECSV